MNSQAQAAAAKDLQSVDTAAQLEADFAAAANEQAAAGPADDKKAEEEDDGEEVDDQGLESKDIELVMAQVCTQKLKYCGSFADNQIGERVSEKGCEGVEGERQ